MDASLVPVSKFLSLVLRHEPQAIGLTLDAQGWADLDELIRLANLRGKRLTRQGVETVVAQNDKRRFVLSDDRQRIRAQQGHSLPVDLAVEPTVPPNVLYHGTATRFLEAIREQGLLRGARHHVHLSADADTATAVGARHGRPVVLTIRAAELHALGQAFYRAGNGVWLTEHVPASHILFAP